LEKEEDFGMLNPEKKKRRGIPFFQSYRKNSYIFRPPEKNYKKGDVLIFGFLV